MHEQGPVDFIEVIHNAVPSEVCAAIVERLRATRGLQPGAVGSGVFPELKHSRICVSVAWTAGRMSTSSCRSRCSMAC